MEEKQPGAASASSQYSEPLLGRDNGDSKKPSHRNVKRSPKKFDSPRKEPASRLSTPDAFKNNVLSTELLRLQKPPSRTRKTVAAFRKRSRKNEYATWKGRVGVHVEVESIDLNLLTTVILKDLTGWELEEFYDVVRLWCPFDDAANQSGSEAVPDTNMATGDGFDAATPEAFVFSFGAAVFWNFPSDASEREWIERHVQQVQVDCCGEGHDPVAMDRAKDEIEFCYGDVNKIHGDLVQLATRDAGEKLAVSFAFAKSSLLSIYEWRLEQTIERNAHIPEELATTGHIKMTRNQVAKEIGRLYLVKHGINLDNSMQDTPEEFWEDDRFQEDYENAMSYFDITDRLDLVNSRLEMIQDLHQVLMDAVQNHHGLVLEWVIIILIAVEVLMDVLEFLR